MVNFENKLLILLIAILALFCTSILQSQDKSPKNIVSEYLDDQIFIEIGNYHSIDKNLHPDFSFPPGEAELIHVISEDYKIESIRQEYLDINYMEPKKELITIVRVIFKIYCQIVIDECKIPEENEYIKEFFLSESTGELLILDIKYARWKTSSIKTVYSWANENRSDSLKMNELAVKLEELLDSGLR